MKLDSHFMKKKNKKYQFSVPGEGGIGSCRQ